MAKILFVSLNEPCKSAMNIGGVVVLVNDILFASNPAIDVDLIVYNKEKISSELPLNIHFVPWNKIVTKVKKRNALASIPKSMFRDYSCYEIDLNGYDKVIYYPYWCSLFRLKNNHANIFTIGMDSGPMLYLRGFVNHQWWLAKVFCIYEFMQALYIDKKSTKISKFIFTVGETDAEFYRSIYLANAKFIPHNVSKLINPYTPQKWGDNEKLKLCLPGGMTKFYVANLLDDIVDKIIENNNFYTNRIELSFLGKIRYKELGKKLNVLLKKGIKIEFTEFAENFEEYISQQHLILMPLEVGAGTKNRALSTIGMGLDIIGTPIALENIYGVKKEHLAYDAYDFIRLINLRLEHHRLYGLSQEEILKFKEWHSVDQWRQNFWKVIEE